MQQQTQRAFDGIAALAEHVGINLRGFHIAMTKLFLHGADIGTGFEQMRGTNSSGMNLNSRRLARRGNYKDVVSKKWRSVWQVTFLLIPAFFAATLMACRTQDSSR